MGISLSELRERLQKPKNKSEIDLAVRHQNRIKFHCEVALSQNMMQPTREFLAFVQNLLPHDKYRTFCTLFRYPVKTNELTAICFDKLARIFDGRNPAFNYQFTSGDAKADWLEYKERLGGQETWKTKGWDNLKTEINSILVVDLPKEQNTEKPEPYFYWLSIEKVLDFEARDGNILWIAYRADGNVVVIDDERYRVFSATKGGSIDKLLSDNPHDLGYCPATFFWNDCISLSHRYVKKSPVTKALESLDWFLYFHISKRHLDLFGAYPVVAGYEPNCDYHNDESGDYCDGGFIKNKRGSYVYDSAGLLMRCPKCGEHRVVGAGTFIEVPVPEGKDAVNLIEAVKIIPIDKKSLDYNVEEEERLKNEIICSIVGDEEEISGNEALNETQIKAKFESQSAILNRVKKGFERAQQFVDETICRLRYGSEFIKCTIDYGTEFFVDDVAELRDRYKLAKESGASDAELDALQDWIIESEYRNNPIKRQRMLLLAELEPYRHLTFNEVVKLFEAGIASREEVFVKLNFSSLIKRFERENINILEFGSDTNFENKISNIYNTLISYATESKGNGEGGNQ